MIWLGHVAQNTMVNPVWFGRLVSSLDGPINLLNVFKFHILRELHFLCVVKSGSRLASRAKVTSDRVSGLVSCAKVTSDRVSAGLKVATCGSANVTKFTHWRPLWKMRSPLGDKPFWVIKSMVGSWPLKIVPGSQIEKSGSQLAPKKFGQLWAL